MCQADWVLVLPGSTKIGHFTFHVAGLRVVSPFAVRSVRCFAAIVAWLSVSRQAWPPCHLGFEVGNRKNIGYLQLKAPVRFSLSLFYFQPTPRHTHTITTQQQVTTLTARCTTLHTLRQSYQPSLLSAKSTVRCCTKLFTLVLPIHRPTVPALAHRIWRRFPCRRLALPGVLRETQHLNSTTRENPAKGKQWSRWSSSTTTKSPSTS